MNQCGILKPDCCTVITCTNSCRSTRAQLYGTEADVGEARATITPVEAPMVWIQGKPTIRAEPLMPGSPLGIVENLDVGPLRRGVAKPLDELRINLFEVLGDVAAQQLVELGIDANHEMLGRDRLVAVEQLEHLAEIAHPRVIRIGLESFVENLASLVGAPTRISSMPSDVFASGNCGGRRWPAGSKLPPHRSGDAIRAARPDRQKDARFGIGRPRLRSRLRKRDDAAAVYRFVRRFAEPRLERRTRREAVGEQGAGGHAGQRVRIAGIDG